MKEIQFPGWLKIDSTEELETNLIGVTVVVLAVNFMGVVFTNDPSLLLEYEAGIALPIAAVGTGFVNKQNEETDKQKQSKLEASFADKHPLRRNHNQSVTQPRTRNNKRKRN